MSNKITTLFFSVINDRRQLYWLLQVLGWSGYAFFVFLGALIYEKVDLVNFLYMFVAAVLGLLLSMAMREAFRAIWDDAPVKRSLVTIMTVMVSTALWALWKFYQYYQLQHHKEITNLLAEYVYWYSYSFFIMLSWTGLYYGIRFYQEMQAEREKNLRIASSAHQSQLKMLRYQLNPHFLFNTLNSISTLIMDSKGEVANNMVVALSKFLRYSLDNDPMQKVSLAQEVEAMQLYLGIEKIRFEERLQLDFRVDDNAKSALIPSMLLQPLIENAVKYAIAKSETGGIIRLEAKVFAGDLLLELSDDGAAILHNLEQLTRSNGVGLTNTRDRLQQLYGDRHACTFSKAEAGGLKVAIRIPFESEELRN